MIIEYVVLSLLSIFMENDQRSSIKPDTTRGVFPNRVKRLVFGVELIWVLAFTACEKKNVSPDYSPVWIVEVVYGNGNKVYRLDVTLVADQPTARGQATWTLTVTANTNTIYIVPFDIQVTDDEKLQIISNINTSLENQWTLTPVSITSVTSWPITVTSADGAITIAKPAKL